MRATIQREWMKKYTIEFLLQVLTGEPEKNCRQHKNKLHENINAGNTYFEIKLQENTFRKKNTFYGTILRVFLPHKIFFQDKTDNI